MDDYEVIAVEVTAEDIANGVPCSSGLCPLALALSRLLGCEVIVSTRTAQVLERGNSRPCSLWLFPRTVEFRQRFDRTWTDLPQAEPGTYFFVG